MIQFWGKLFGINFVIGVVIGLIMEFQFGMNWLYYFYYVGDIFGVFLVIEGLMVFFLEFIFVGLFFFGWDKMFKVKYFMVIWLVVIGFNFLVFWILIVNGWMQYLVGVEFNFEVMCMEMISFVDVIFNLVVQVKFVYMVLVGYVIGVMFVLVIFSYYLLNYKYIVFVCCLFVIVVSFGLVVILLVIVLGDESGYELGDV